MRGIDRFVELSALFAVSLAVVACADSQRDSDMGDGPVPGSEDDGGQDGDGDDGTGADDGDGDGGDGDGTGGGTDDGGDDGGDGGGDEGDTGDDSGGGDEGDTGDGGDDGGAGSDQIALFAINEGNFNGDTDAGIWSIMTGCQSPSFDAYMAKVAEFPELSDAKHFVTGWSCGATYALIRGYEHADVFSGIVHINQASVPGYEQYLEEAFQKGGETRIPVYIIHDFSYDAGGTYTIQWLKSKGYEEGVDLFVMDRPGTGHEPYLTDEQKRTLEEWFRR